MSDNNDDMQKYGFMYVDCTGKIYRKEIETPGATWHECLNDYVRFLETIYGYDILEQVRIKEPKWLDSMCEHHPSYLDPWTGKYFTDEEEIGNDDLGDW
jgi:hypothetical protein